jgi:hypothetical protein
MNRVAVAQRDRNARRARKKSIFQVKWRGATWWKKRRQNTWR